MAHLQLKCHTHTLAMLLPATLCAVYVAVFSIALAVFTAIIITYGASAAVHDPVLFAARLGAGVGDHTLTLGGRDCNGFGVDHGTRDFTYYDNEATVHNLHIVLAEALDYLVRLMLMAFLCVSLIDGRHTRWDLRECQLDGAIN